MNIKQSAEYKKVMKNYGDAIKEMIDAHLYYSKVGNTKKAKDRVKNAETAEKEAEKECLDLIKNWNKK